MPGRDLQLAAIGGHSDPTAVLRLLVDRTDVLGNETLFRFPRGCLDRDVSQRLIDRERFLLTFAEFVLSRLCR
ncbi:MAG: hypothetical protein ACTHNN_05330 [Xanthobacteraceae bacterium]